MRYLKRLLKRRGKVRSHELVTEFVPLVGVLRNLWLDGHYGSVIAYVKLHKDTPGRVQSIRLVFRHYDQDGKPVGDVVQARSLNATQAEWETYGKYALPESASEAISGLLLRIVRKK